MAWLPLRTPRRLRRFPRPSFDVLTSAIPTEPLVAYTAILGFIAGTIDSTKPREYLPLRWVIYGAFLALIVGAVAITYLRGASPVKKRAFPFTEGLAALIAGAAWGLAMPGSALNAQLTGTLRAITSATIAIGAAAVLAIVFVPPLKTGTKTPAQNAGSPPQGSRNVGTHGIDLTAPVATTPPASTTPPAATTSPAVTTEAVDSTQPAATTQSAVDSTEGFGGS